MNQTTSWMAHENREYEAILEECKMTADAGYWKDAIQLFHDFVEILKQQMRMKDEVLYPAFVEEVHDSSGVIAELIDDHNHIAQLLHDLDHVIKRHDIDHFEASLQPLYRAMTLHTEHEEEIFFSLGNDFLLMSREEILARLNALKTSQKNRSHDVKSTA